MLTLDLPKNMEQAIIQDAQAQNLTVSELIARQLPNYATPQKDLASLKAAAGLMRGKMMDGSEYQTKIRAEWD